MLIENGRRELTVKGRLRGVLAAGAVLLMAGCTQSRYEPVVHTNAVPAEQWVFKPIEIKYIDTLSPAWNFQNVLDYSARKCSQEAAMGYILYSQLRGYGSSKRPDDHAQALADCQQYASQRGDEAITRLKQAQVSTKILAISKELYSTWSAYVAGMTISAPKDSLAASGYETSKNALLAEDKFAN